MNVTEDMSLIERLRGQFPEAVLEAQEFRGETSVTVQTKDLVDVCAFLRDDPELQYTTLLFVTGLDRSELGTEPRFATVYQLYSIPRRRRLRLKTTTSGNPPTSVVITGRLKL